MTDLISTMLGKVFTSVTRNEESIRFKNDSEEYVFQHSQECCEEVYIEDIVGDLNDLVNSPITFAEKVSNAEDPGQKSDSDVGYTWTYYKFATVKGWVDVRWYGSSNGYYSTGVDLRYIGPDGKTETAYSDE